jgi:hypothetical protein
VTGRARCRIRMQHAPRARAHAQPTHACAHTHVRATHARTCAGTNPRAQRYTYAHALHGRTRCQIVTPHTTRTHTQEPHTHTCARTHTIAVQHTARACTYASHSQARTLTRTHTNALTHARAHTHAHARARTPERRAGAGGALHGQGRGVAARTAGCGL